MPIFEEEKILDLPVEGQDIPKPALGSPAYVPYPSPPALSSAGMLFGGAFKEDDNLSRRGLTNDQLSKIATMPSKDTGPNLIPLSEVAANKRYNTYVRGVDLENIYGLQQSWYEQLGNSAIKFAGLTAGSFAQSFATLPNMISAAQSGSASERLARLSGDPDGYEAKIDNWTRNMEDIFPNYITKRERENPLMGIIPFMPGSANFWGENILKNLGFTAGSIAGALAQDAIIGTVTGGVGALPVAAAQIGKASLWLNKILAGTNKIDAALDLGKAVGASSKAILSAKNLGQAAEGIRTLDKVRYGLVLTGSARTEAAIEARDTYRVLKDELTQEYIKKNGVEPEGEALREIENYATAGMNTRFGVNMALLTLSNTIQFGNMFKSFTTSSSQLANTVTRNIDDLGKVRLKDGSLDVFEKVVPETRIGKIWESVRPTVKNVFAEGVYEEGGQFAAEKGVYDYYTRKYKNLSNPDNANTWNSLNEAVDSTVKGLNEQFGSGEGVQNMVVGAITALITGKAMGAIQKKMGVPTDDEKLQSTLSIINNYGLTGILSQQYSDVAASAGIAREMDEAVKEGNIFKYNNLKKDLFFKYVSSRIPIGMHDVTIEQLKMLKTLDKEEFEKTFGMSFDASSKKTVNDYVDNLILQANQIKDITDSLDATFKNPYKFNINAKEGTEDFVNNLNYQAFNSWKRDLAYYAYEVPADNQRIASIQQSLGNVNPALSTSLLSDLTNKDSLKSLSKEYELEAARIEKGITDMMPVAAAREIRANARALRTLSERINLAINNNTANDTKLFNDVLNFELTSRNPKAEKIIGLEKATELFNYGVDINLINNRKEIARDKYEYLSSEKGFFEYMEEEQQVNEDLQKEAPEEAPKEEAAVLPPTTPKYKDVAGVEQPLEQGRTYEIAPFKKPTINKIADNRYEVVSPDGKSTFYNNEEDAKEALDELSQKLKALESVKVLAFNPDGTIKIEDINGDVYNIPAGSLDGYSKRETEQEKLARNKEEVDNLQKEIDNNSPTVATEEYPLKEGYQKDIEDGSTAIDEIDFKKSWKYLFWSTTSASEIRDVDSKKPHAVRAISFLQKAKEFPNRGALRVMLVTPYQEEAMGLRGITKLSTGEDPKSNITDFDNEVIFAVYVEQKDGKLFFVGQDGNIISAVGEQVDMDKVVFNTMPTTALTWGTGGQGKARYRGKEEREAKIMSARWGVKRKEMFEATKKSPDVPEVYSFQISLGIPVIDSMEDKNPVAKSLFDPSLKNGDKIIRNEEGLLQVSTTGMISHQGVNYKVPKGQIRISYGDMLAPAVNNKLGKNKATAIFEVLKAMAEDMMEKSKKKQKIKFPLDYEEFIINTLYWRKSPDTKKSNQIFIDDEMNIVIGGKKYDITNLESYRKEIIDNLSDAYHIVNNKSLGSAVEGGVSKFRRPFIEYFVDKDGKLQNREWTNYQTYLLSDKLPDGSARSSSEIPVTTFIRSITEALPYNFVQKYSILQPTGFVNLPIPAEEKKAPAPTPTPSPTPTAPAKIVVDGNEIVADGKTLNTSTKAFKSGNPVQYTITIDDDGKVKSVLVDVNNQTSNTIKDVAETPAMLQAVDNALKQGNAYDEKLSPVARVALFAASKIKLYFEQELAKAPTAVSTETAKADIERRKEKILDAVSPIISADEIVKNIDKVVEATSTNRFGETDYRTTYPYRHILINNRSYFYDTENKAFYPTRVSSSTDLNLESIEAYEKTKILPQELKSLNKTLRLDPLSSRKDAKGKLIINNTGIFEGFIKSTGISSNKNPYDVIANDERFKDIVQKIDAELAALEGAKPAEAPAVEEVVPVKKNKGGKFKKRDSPAARVIGKKEKVKPKISEYDIELFKQYHSEVAPNVPYEIAERIFILHDGERAYGVFENGVAKFYKGAIRGTEYHELFEGIWKAFLTSEERQEILDELKALPGTFTDRASGKKLRWDEATDKQIKERIADDFAEYRLGKLPARTLLEKIVRFFKNIINYFRNMVSAPKSRKEKLFRDIDAGRFKDFKISDEVRMDEMVEASAVEGLIESDVKKFVQDISAEIFSYIFSNNKSLFELSKITNEEVYNHVKSLYIFEDRLNDEDPDALSTKQFNEVFQRVYDFIRTFRIEFDDENLSYVNDSDANNRNYAPEPFSTDWKKQSPYPVKLLIGTLIKTDPTSVDALTGLAEAKLSEGINGFQLIDFGRAFAMMLDKLSNTTSIKDFGKKLSQIAKFSTDYGRLLVRLKTNKETGFIDFESMSLDDMRLFIQTYQTFAAKQKPLALIQYVSGDAVRTGAANLFTAVREKKEDWLSNLRMIAKDKESIVKFDADQKTYFVKDLKGIPVSTVEEKIEFLKKMGIEFPMSTYVKLKSVKEPTERRSDRDKFGDAVNSIYEYVGKNEGIGTISGKTLKVDGPLSTLATLYVSYENPAQETTRFNVENKRVNEYTENNLPSVFENDFSESETIEELKARRPELNDEFTTHSVILKKGGLFYDQDGEKIGKVKVGYIEGVKDANNSKNTTTSRLSESDRLVLQLNQNINGRYYIILPADGSTEWLLSMGSIIGYEKIAGGRAWDEVYKIFQGYLKDEIELAKSDRSYLVNTAPRAKELRFFKEILSGDLLKKVNSLILDNATKETINKFIEDNSSDINDAVKSFIEEKVERVSENLISNKKVEGSDEIGWSFELLDSDFAEQFKINKNSITKEELNNILTFANMNYIIANIEMHKVLFGDPYQFKIKDNILDELKRIKSSLSPRRTTVDSPEINNKLNKEHNTVGDKIPLLPGESGLPDTPGYHDHKSFVTTATLYDVNIVGSLANVNPSYVKTNETDGFSIIMDGTYREVKEKNGQWTPQADKWHNWQMSYTRKRLDEKGVWKYPEDGKLKAYDEKILSKPAPSHIVEVLKPIVTGNKANRNRFDQVIDKFSQMPLYYSMVEGRNLEDLYIKMWKEKIGYVVYESGRKEGIEEKIHPVYLDGGKFNPEPFNNRIEVPWKAYGVQVETSYDDFKEDVSMGSQPTKIISIDLFENAVPVSAKAGDEYQRNVRILNDIHKHAYYQLLKKMGIEDLGNGFKIVDRKALSKSLEHEILRRELSQNVADTVRLNKDGQFPIPFEASNSYIQIRDVIFSMIDKALISKKMHGGAFVQTPVTMWEDKGKGRSLVKKEMVYNGKDISMEEYEKLSKDEQKNVKFRYDKISSAEYEKLSDKEKKLVSLTSDTLKMPTPEDPFMEVMLPHWFREKLPSKLKRMSDDQLLSHLNTTEDGKKLLQAFGFRIPTQALSSMSAIRVAGFLPQYMGYTVVVPSEITTMAGSDFDIDKMFIYLKSYYVDKNDNIRLVKYLDSEEATKEFFTNLYESRMNDELDKITRFEEFREKLIDILNSIQQLDDTSLEQLETLSDEDFEFYANHAVLINEIIDQAEEEQTTPKDYILEQIKRLGEKKEKFTEKLLNTDLKEKYVERMYRRALENEYFDSMINLITLPEAYDRLISPVDDAGLKDVAGEIEKLRGDSELDEKGNPRVKGRLLDMSFMNNLRHAFITAKRWVGIAAVNITGLSVAQKSKVYIDTRKLSYLDEADKKFLGDGSIALPHNKVTIDGRTYASFSGTKTADGKEKYISSRLSGYLTTFVDVAKDPYIMKIIRSELLISTAMFLERIGAGEYTPLFINQPIIVEYVKYLENNGIKSLFSKAGLEMVQTMFPASQTAIDNASIDVSIDAMKDNIESYYKKGTFTEEQNAKQLLIFEEFLKYAKMAQHSFKLNMATNYDTSKFRSAGILIRKIFRTQSAKRKNIFSSVDDILNNSHIGLQAEFIESAVMATGEYLQLNKPEILENIITPVLQPYIENEYLNEEDFMKIEMMVTSAFLDYLQQTKTGINEEVRRLTTDESTSVAKMLRDAKMKYPDNELLQNLSIRQKDEGGPMTVKLLANNKSSGIDENYYIGMMRELRDNPDTEALYRGLVKLSIIQGSHQSAVSIKNIIPVEDYSDLLKDKLMNIRYSEQEMDAFKDGMFHRNNWRNERVFKKAYPNFIINPRKQPIMNEDGEPMYEYFSFSFPIVPTISAERKNNLILTLSEKYNSKEAGSEYVLVDRLLKKPKGDFYVDIATGDSYSMSDYRRLIAKGNAIAKQVYGYQLVKYQDGTPVVTYDKDGNMSYVYKLINLYADAPNVYEYYTDFIESKIPNNSAKIKNEIDNDLIYKYFEGVNEKNPKAPAKQEQVDDAPFDVDEAVETTTTSPTPLTSMSEITNHSGGAALSDTEWDQIGREYGVINHFHYREPLDYIDTKGEPAKGSKTLDSKRLQAAGITPTYISQKDYDEGAAKATKAFRMMYKDSEYKSVRSAYIIRNWMQVKNADAVFAIGTIKQPGENASDKADETRIAAIPIIKGGTGYAVQMAINEGKPVYVFDGTKAGWYKYDYNSKTFVPTETPTLTKNFAGIGSRTLGTQEVINKSIQAIRDVYEKTKNSISTAPTAPVSKIVANIPQNKVSGVESYGSLVTAAPNVIKALGPNPHSIDMIEAGLRTRTTRSADEMAKYNVKVGDTIKHFGKSANGTTKEILARVTAIHPKGSAGWKGTWAKEGWRIEDASVIDRFKDGAAAIEFEVIKPTIPIETPVTKTFEEFGTQYRFTLENGVPVKGEFKQGGKDWQEMNAKNVGKKYAELSQKPVVKTPPVEEPPVFIGENTFTFSDGTVINTGNIKLNAQQEVALQLAVNAINRKQTKFVLSGYAGTGKSTISKFIREYLQQSKSFKNIVYSSPTHKANVNLLLQLLRGKIFNVIPSTVATVLNKRKIDNEWVPGPRNKMPSNGVLIVDESSMINDEDYRLLTNLAKSKNSSIIFMGDPAQLPPVSSNEISKAMQFSTPEEGIELTQVMRQQGDNPLLDVLTNIRDNLKSKTDTFSFVSNVNSKGEGISFTKDFNHFNEKINEYFSSKEYKEDPTYAKILTYTNASVANYNDMIQNLLGLEPYSPNSIMMGYEQVGTSSMINNGQDYIILNSEYVSNQPVKVFKGNILNRSFDIQSEVSGYKVTLRKVFSKEDEEILLDNGQSNIIVPIEIFIINPNDDNNIDFMKKVLSFKQVLNDYTIPWSARENAVTEFENFFNIYQFPADMINYKGTITTLQKLKEDNPKLFKLNPTTGTSEFQETGLSERTVLPKNIDYGYAVTSHKGQGSTYKYIFADLQNMDNPANLRIIKDKGKDFAIERQQLKYVGLSRASVEVFAYTRKTNESTLKEGKVIKEAALSQPSAFDLLTEFTPERKQEILSNFASKHKMTIEKAKDYINEAIATKGKEIVIAQLNKTDEQGNKCY